MHNLSTPTRLRLLSTHLMAALALASVSALAPALAQAPKPAASAAPAATAAKPVNIADSSGLPQFAPAPKPGERVLKYAILIAETGFDPAQISDLYSNTMIQNMMEGLYEYDPLDHAVVRPLTAAALPEITNDFKTFTIKLKPGILFADHPSFGGKKRELTAQDYVYSFKRFYDPANKSPNLYQLENSKILGLSELRKQAMADKKPFPYDIEVEGIKALDRYTLQFNLAIPQPRFARVILAQGSPFVAVAREVVEAAGDKIMATPVGTGPFRLTAWKRSAKMVFERNPNYRNPPFESTIGPDQGRKSAIYAALKGKPMPMLDRVEVSIIEESQPRYLAFLNGETDTIELPNDFMNLAIPNNKLAPNLTKAGIVWDRIDNPDVAMSFFNMEHPVVGGYEPAKVALRRAIGLAGDETERRRQIYRNQAVVGQGLIPHNTYGYDAGFTSLMSEFNVAKAQALLDTYGYVDKDGDGWRDLPDGKPLLLEYASQPDGLSRQMAELWKKHMDRIKVKIEFKIAKWPENLKASQGGRLMMWGVGWNGGSPDSDTFLALAYGPNKGGANHSRFNLPEFNELYEKQKGMADSPERIELMRKASNLAVTYMPYKIHVNRRRSDLIQPWVVGWSKHPYQREVWKFSDVDDSKRKK
jgi:ABC-type transport system substrate-binding protein